MEEKHRLPSWVLPALICLTLCFIWGNSLMPARISAEISNWFREIINKILWFLPGGAELEGDGILRKIAHASEFALLGAELTAWRVKEISKISDALLGGILAALTDETIQLFVAGRSGEVRDVLIDTAGVVLGCAVVLVVRRVRAKRRAG